MDVERQIPSTISEEITPIEVEFLWNVVQTLTNN